MKKTFRIVIGALLVAVGVIYILSVFGIADVNVSFDGWWALFIIIPCLEGLIKGNDRLGSLAGLFFGVLLFLAAKEYIEYGLIWKLIVPVIFVVWGIKIICRTSERKAVQKPEIDDEGSKLAKVSAVFGGATANLMNSKITDGAQIDVICVFGGADIILPENVNVKINAFCLFGGVSDERTVNSTDENAITLNINGLCIFGGADIRNPQ